MLTREQARCGSWQGCMVQALWKTIWHNLPTLLELYANPMTWHFHSEEYTHHSSTTHNSLKLGTTQMSHIGRMD